ncbi:MAG: hypothetical protein ACJATI_001872 [Halioglobus sp.]|jgi:hypothetical protein
MKTNKYISTIKPFLDRPFPEAVNLSTYVKTMFIIGTFVALFLGLIQPFNMDQIQGTAWTHAILFGIITFLTGISYEIMLKYVLKIKKEGKSYTFVKWMTQVIGLLLFISLFNYLYLAFQFGMPLSGLMYMIWATFLVGIFPTVFIGTISMIKSEKRNSEIADTLNRKTINPKPNSHETLIFDISTKKIWLIESLQNYVNIYYWNDTSMEKKTERATLKSCEDQIKNTNLLRCHRSFIVNTSKIENVSGNAQGLKLKLSNYDVLIPVSRSYIPLFKA